MSNIRSFEASKFCQTSKNAVMSIGSIQNSGVNQFKIAQYCATFQRIIACQVKMGGE
jgi:hypothetical protein